MTTTKQDIWTPSQVNICTEYALGNTDTVLNLVSNNADGFGFVNTIMRDKLINGLLRERIISKLNGVVHSCTMHNYDAYNTKKGRWCEIKSEQHCTLTHRRDQVTGGGAFGSIQDFDSVDTLMRNNPIMHVNTFIDGRLVYNVSFDFNDSKIAERLKDTVIRRSNGAKTAPKFMWSDWENAKSLEVTHFNPIYFAELRPFISSKLAIKVEKTWKFQNNLRNELLNELTQQTP
jgi:hypothetical protein